MLDDELPEKITLEL